MVFVTVVESSVGSYILLNLLQKGISRFKEKKNTCLDNFLLNKFLEKVEWVQALMGLTHKRS